MKKFQAEERDAVLLDLDDPKTFSVALFGVDRLFLLPHDGLLYVTTELDQTITVIKPKILKIAGAIPTGQALTHMLVMDHKGQFGYLSNIQSGSISVLDILARKLLTFVPVSAKIQRIAISTDDKRIFTADQTEPRVAVIDTATRKVGSWIPLPAIGYTLTTTQDGRWLLVGIQSTSQIAVIDLKWNKVVRTIDLLKSPHEILMSPDGTTAFVSCTANAQVAAVRTSDWTVTKLIKVGTRVMVSPGRNCIDLNRVTLLSHGGG